MPSLRSRLRGLLLSPADRRLEAALIADPPQPPPFGPGPRAPANIPVPNWDLDQPAPPREPFVYRPNYSNHTFQSFAAPIAFEGFGVERIRSAIAQHRQGLFIETSLLCVAVLSFAPVLAALQQAIAPALGLDRHIRGGSRGLSRLVAAEVEEQLVPRSGLLPSPYFPPTLWGTMAIYYRLMGFCVLQHVDGEPDPLTGVRPRYTRVWPPWAVKYYRYRQTFVANTTEGDVDILNDGKFTLVADETEPHFSGAILALGLETLDGTLVKQARASWINRYGNPKWVGTMPEKVGTRTKEGDDFFAALATILGPDGFGVLPHGATFQTVGLSGEASGSFKEALDNVILMVAMTLLGSDGTIRAGGDGGAGPYRAPGFWGVRRDLISRMLAAMTRAVNGGHIAPYLDINYAAGIELAKARGTWVEPVLDIPLPDPDTDARIQAYAARVKVFFEIVDSWRENGFAFAQEDVNKLATRLEIDPPQIIDGQILGGKIEQWMVEQKIIAPDQLLARLGYPALPDDAGSVARLAEERNQGRDKTGTVKVSETEDIKPAEGEGPAEPVEEAA